MFFTALLCCHRGLGVRALSAWVFDNGDLCLSFCLDRTDLRLIVSVTDW